MYNFEMIIKTKLQIAKLKWTKQMNKNSLLFELIKLYTRIWIEALGEGVQGIWRRLFKRRSAGVGWERFVSSVMLADVVQCCSAISFPIFVDLFFDICWCLIQCYAVPIYRIQYEIKSLHMDGKDWIIK